MTTDRRLNQHTYMKIGGPADEIVTARSVAELQSIVAHCLEKKQRYFILGSGSNTLFTEAGFRGTVILNRLNSVDVDPNASQLTAASGCLMNALVNQTVSLGLSGLEWYLGLPGTLGGAIYNNAHFQNHLLAETVVSVQVLTPTGDIKTLTSPELAFGYDSSRFHQSREIILSATLQLTPVDQAKVAAVAQAALKQRRLTQPLTVPSSGCFFQNPPSGPSAGSLIDQAGLKHTTVGGAMVSPVHANFIVNTGQATADDVLTLAQKIETTVQSKFGVHLTKEVFFINEFGERI